ncbi:MAG: hypothetical protein Phyf2KO_08170 [Phycisphaerales bacterium]
MADVAAVKVPDCHDRGPAGHGLGYARMDPGTIQSIVYNPPPAARKVRSAWETGG